MAMRVIEFPNGKPTIVRSLADRKDTTLCTKILKENSITIKHRRMKHVTKA